MIVSFDGNVYCGKTTIINKLAKKSCKIKEYCNYLDKINKEKRFNNRWLNTQLRYLKIDAQRNKNLNNFEINLLDRSFISLCAHVWALYRLRKTDIRKEFLEFLKKYMLEDKIILPDIFVHVTCDYSIAKNRFIQNEKTKHAKGTDRLLINKHYFFFVNEFNELWSQKLQQSITIDTNKKFENTLSKINKSLNKKINRNKKTYKAKIIKTLEGVYGK